MNKIICFLVITILFLNCSSQKVIKKDQKNDKGKMGIINESFDPLILNDDDLVIKKNLSKEAKSDLDDSLISNVTEEDHASEVQGYRVQICAVSNEETARDIQREAILKFNENVYLNYDSPYYKVRIGDCKTRYEADRLQKSAVEKGFQDAWVIKTKVKSIPRSTEENEDYMEN